MQTNTGKIFSHLGFAVDFSKRVNEQRKNKQTEQQITFKEVFDIRMSTTRKCAQEKENIVEIDVRHKTGTRHK